MPHISSSEAMREGRLKVVTNWDVVDPHTHFDEPEFIACCIEVQRAIENGATSTREIKEALGDKLNPRFNLFDMLDSLEGVGAIIKTRDISPIRYAPKGAPKVRELKWNEGLKKATDPQPYPENIFGGNYL